MPASRTSEPIWPSQPYQIFTTCDFGAKTFVKFLEGFRKVALGLRYSLFHFLNRMWLRGILQVVVT
jgi:hypothetical protein